MVLVAVKPLAVSYMICGFRRLTIAEDEARDERKARRGTEGRRGEGRESRDEGWKEGKVRDEKGEARDGRKLGTGVAMSRTEQ